MAERPVVASNPISFLTNDGRQLEIPLSALYFDTTGSLKADRWPLYVANQSAVDPLLKRLLTTGDVSVGPEPTAKPALVATAVTSGATGVSLVIDIANVTPNTATPPSSTADVTVTETDTYTALALAKVVDTLGATAGAGTRPGLAFVSSAGAPTLPKAGSYAFAIAAPGSAAQVDIPKNSGAGNAFTLQARTNDAAGALTKADIKDVDTTAQTFTLVLTWTKSVTATAISGLAAAFAYTLTITAPADGYRAPSAGKTVLVGGADAMTATAVKASATVLSA